MRLDFEYIVGDRVKRLFDIRIGGDWCENLIVGGWCWLLFMLVRSL